MRFATVFLTGALAAFASAQSTVTSAAPAQSSQQAAIAKCLAACEDGDVNCTSKCIAVPNPNPSQVNDTNKCVAECPQGKGTAADNAAYQKCVEGCIGKYFFTATGTPSVPTAGAGTGSGNGGSGSSGGSGSNGNGNDSGNGNGDKDSTPTGTQGGPAPTGSGTATGTGAPAQNTNAAGKVGSVGLAGLAVMGLLAL